MSPKDNNEERLMYSKSDNIEILINGKAVKDSDFIFGCVHLSYYKFYQINPNQGGSYIDSPDWIKNKKATINPVNKKDHKCFQCSNSRVKLLRNKKDPQRITKIKLLLNKYN